jgi:trigger factor
VEYPPNYPQKTLAGKTTQYKVKVETIKEKKLPELNDELAQSLGQYKSLDELKSKIREDLEKHKKERAEEQLRDRLLEWLETHNEFEIPQSLVERQIEIRLQRLIRDLARQGINPQRLDVDWSKIREDQHHQAIRDVKGSLLLDYIADKESIQVTDDEIEAEIDRIASETNRPAEKVKEVLGRESGMERLKGQIRSKKTLDFLQERANIQPVGTTV